MNRLLMGDVYLILKYPGDDQDPVVLPVCVQGFPHQQGIRPMMFGWSGVPCGGFHLEYGEISGGL